MAYTVEALFLFQPPGVNFSPFLHPNCIRIASIFRPHTASISRPTPPSASALHPPPPDRQRTPFLSYCPSFLASTTPEQVAGRPQAVPRRVPPATASAKRAPGRTGGGRSFRPSTRPGRPIQPQPSFSCRAFPLSPLLGLSAERASSPPCPPAKIVFPPFKPFPLFGFSRFSGYWPFPAFVDFPVF